MNFLVIFKNGWAMTTDSRKSILADVDSIEVCRMKNGPTLVKNGKVTTPGKFILFETSHFI
jgi:hypothetical protein